MSATGGEQLLRWSGECRGWQLNHAKHHQCRETHPSQLLHAIALCFDFLVLRAACRSFLSPSLVVGTRPCPIASFSMKRLFLSAPLAVALLLSGVVGASASTLSRQLLSPEQLSSSWSRYSVEEALLTGCPESSFAATNPRSTARIFMVQASSMTVLAEKLDSSSEPAQAFARAVATTTRCRTATSIDGTATFPRIRTLSLGNFGVPIRAFSLHAVVGGTAVTGCVAYGLKGDVVLTIGELSMGSINERSFKSDVAHALAKIPA